MKTFKLITNIIFMAMLSSCSLMEDIDDKFIPVRQGEKWGYINNYGEYIVNPQFINAERFSEGLAFVSIGEYPNIKIGVINESGKYEIPPKYCDYTPFHNKCAWVVLPDSAPMLINTNGDVLFTYKKGQKVHPYFEGLAIVKGSSGKQWTIDESGNTVFELPDGYSFESVFNEGMAVVKNMNEKYGYVDTKGNITIMCQYTDAQPFINGKAVVKKNEQYGTINKKGEYIINPQFDGMFSDNDNYLIVMNEQFGWCDGKGKITINPQFEKAFPFLDSDLTVFFTNEKAGFIDRDGKYAINPQFDYAYPFNGSTAPVMVEEKWGLIDETGKFVSNPQFNSVRHPRLLTELINEYVISRYFDVEDIVKHITSMFSGKKFDDMKITETSISQFRDKYDLINQNSIYNMYSNDLEYEIEAHGNFTQVIFDEWWGINVKELPEAKIDYISLDIHLSKSSKTDEVIKSIKDALKLKRGKTASGLYMEIKKIPNEYYTISMKISDKIISE